MEEARGVPPSGAGLRSEGRLIVYMYSVVDSAALEVLEAQERAAGRRPLCGFRWGTRRISQTGWGFMVEGDDVVPP